MGLIKYIFIFNFFQFELQSKPANSDPHGAGYIKSTLLKWLNKVKLRHKKQSNRKQNYAKENENDIGKSSQVDRKFITRMLI